MQQPLPSRSSPAPTSKPSRAKLAVHYSSKSDEWATPQKLFDELNDKYGPIVLDVCATFENTKCTYWFGAHRDGSSTDGLNIDWHEFADTVWMNPPYSRGQQWKWIKKASDEAAQGVTTVALLPARTDTRAFHAYIYKQPNVEIEFLKGRVKFGGAKHGAPFPSMVVVFRPRP
jgi:phage N-6-adenine-methyltransferase